MPNYPDDLDLVERIINGDLKAAEDFGHMYLPKFESIARHRGVPFQDCGDVAQEVFVTCIDQMRRRMFRGESSLSTWLARIVHGKVVDYWRARQQRGDILPPPSPSDSNEIALVENLPSDLVDYTAVLSVREALERMPADLRVILLLNRNEGVTIEAISNALSLTKGQVSSRLYKAEEMFRRLITKGLEK